MKQNRSTLSAFSSGMAGILMALFFSSPVSSAEKFSEKYICDPALSNVAILECMVAYFDDLEGKRLSRNISVAQSSSGQNMQRMTLCSIRDFRNKSGKAKRHLKITVKKTASAFNMDMEQEACRVMDI